MIMSGCTIEREKNRRCPEHGIKSMTVPWALRESRFATTCEVFAIEVLLMTQTVKGVLAISRRHVEDTTWRIIERTVAREKVREEPSLLPRIGIVEKVPRVEYKRLLKDGDDRLEGNWCAWVCAYLRNCSTVIPLSSKFKTESIEYHSARNALAVVRTPCLVCRPPSFTR
jgi:hypothetical protein